VTHGSGLIYVPARLPMPSSQREDQRNALVR